MTSRLDNERLAVLVHEVRSPVAALAAVAETAAESSHVEPETLHVLVRLSLAACHAIERLVMDAAVASVHFSPVDLGALTTDAIAAHQGGRADIAVAVEDDLVVDGDPVRLRQVVDNLIANAVVHGGSAGVTVNAARSGGAIHLVVSDAGPGIPAAELDRIFEVGVRLQDDMPGSGLGLALARAIVEAHGGSLSGRSGDGVGATFTISLPAAQAQPDTPASSV